MQCAHDMLIGNMQDFLSPDKTSSEILTRLLNSPVIHTCQVLGKSKSEIARAPLIFAYNLVIERVEKSGAQVLRVRFFSLFKQT